MKIFGFDTSDPGGLQNALKAAETNIEQVRSVIQESENRIYGIIRGSFDGAYLAIEDGKITLHLAPVPKAVPVNSGHDATTGNK